MLSPDNKCRVEAAYNDTLKTDKNYRYTDENGRPNYEAFI